MACYPKRYNVKESPDPSLDNLITQKIEKLCRDMHFRAAVDLMLVLSVKQKTAILTILSPGQP